MSNEEIEANPYAAPGTTTHTKRQPRWLVAMALVCLSVGVLLLVGGAFHIYALVEAHLQFQISFRAAWPVVVSLTQFFIGGCVWICSAYSLSKGWARRGIYLIVLGLALIVIYFAVFTLLIP